MLRILLHSILLVGIASVLSACGGGGSSSPVPKEQLLSDIAPSTGICEVIDDIVVVEDETSCEYENAQVMCKDDKIILQEGSSTKSSSANFINSNNKNYACSSKYDDALEEIIQDKIDQEKATKFSITSKSADTTIYEDTVSEETISVRWLEDVMDELTLNTVNAVLEITGGADASLFYLRSGNAMIESIENKRVYDLLLYDSLYTTGANAPDTNGDGIYELELTATDSEGQTIVLTINYTFK